MGKYAHLYQHAYMKSWKKKIAYFFFNPINFLWILIPLHVIPMIVIRNKNINLMRESRLRNWHLYAATI